MEPLLSKVNPLRTLHIGFTVKNLDGAVMMFKELLGYEVVSRGTRNPKGVARLTGVAGADIIVVHLEHAGLVPVELIQYVAPEGQNSQLRPCDAGFTHLTYQVADIDAAVAAAAPFGLRPLGEIVGNTRIGQPSSPRVVYLRDSNGVHIEFVQPDR